MSRSTRPLSELDGLLLRIKTLVKETTLLRESGVSNASLSAQSREIERLKSRLADLVRQDPMMGGTRRVTPRRR